MKQRAALAAVIRPEQTADTTQGVGAHQQMRCERSWSILLVTDARDYGRMTGLILLLRRGSAGTVLSGCVCSIYVGRVRTESPARLCLSNVRRAFLVMRLARSVVGGRSGVDFGERCVQVVQGCHVQAQGVEDGCRHLECLFA